MLCLKQNVLFLHLNEQEYNNLILNFFQYGRW